VTAAPPRLGRVPFFILYTVLSLLLCARPGAGTGPAAGDDNDRTAFAQWFTLLADAQFERKSDDVIDCSSLVRHAYREALRAHTPAWRRAYGLALPAALPDVRVTPPMRDGAWLLFRVGTSPDRFAEFADAGTLVRYNTRPIGRDVRAARPGDLLYFRQDADHSPSHLMVFVGTSHFEPAGSDWIVYHTGPDGTHDGEVRKVPLADLVRHPAPRWRPVAANPAFVGVFRWTRLSREGQ
jgi:uncharacterized protein YfaT (DUF1175 family)